VSRPRVVLLRGYSANPWDLQPWRLLGDRFDVTCLVPGANEFAAAAIGLPVVPVRATRDRLPSGRAMRALSYAVGDRYNGLDDLLTGADIVHSADLATWFSAQAAGLKEQLGFRLVLTVWETIPFLSTYRWPRDRRWRERSLAATDLFVAASERARSGLLLEGVDPQRIVVSYPGIDSEHFAASSVRPSQEPGLVLSPGRLVWEKGHQDVIRAVAALRRGLVPGAPEARLLLVGSGPDEPKLRRYCDELGIADAVEFRSGVPYTDMPDVYARASCMVLASLAIKGWEEQFGMVLAESLAAGLPIVASSSGAIPEVVGGSARMFVPGDWHEIARGIAETLSQPSSRRVVRDPERVARYSSAAASERIAAAYDRLLAG
jgi:glycosyltransferase involved in cell wall biosynthesis